MYQTVRHSNKYNMDSAEDNHAYESILNDPLCTIVTERIEKTREEEFNEETGRLSRSYEILWRIVIWDEKVLLI
jgi:hypothetical protein